MTALVSIWVDADACPVVVRDILFRAAERTGVQLVLVANRALQVPTRPNIRSMQVKSGFDEADDEIVRQSAPGDLVITADIPLAAELLQKDVDVLNPRGERYSKSTIGAKLAMRDFMDTMRSSGVHSGGPSTYGQVQRQAFANQLDQWLTRRLQGLGNL